MASGSRSLCAPGQQRGPGSHRLSHARRGTMAQRLQRQARRLGTADHRAPQGAMAGVAITDAQQCVHRQRESAGGLPLRIPRHWANCLQRHVLLPPHHHHRWPHAAQGLEQRVAHEHHQLPVYRRQHDAGPGFHASALLHAHPGSARARRDARRGGAQQAPGRGVSLAGRCHGVLSPHEDARARHVLRHGHCRTHRKAPQRGCAQLPHRLGRAAL